MLNFLVTLLATLLSILRSRAVLELENLALRHQIGVLQRSTGPSVMGLAVPHLEPLALGAGHRSTRDGDCLASQGLWSVLVRKIRPGRSTRSRNWHSLRSCSSWLML